MLSTFKSGEDPCKRHDGSWYFWISLQLAGRNVVRVWSYPSCSHIERDATQESFFLQEYINTYSLDLVPKGMQEKRTEVLENKFDRMWVSNAFFEWTHVKSSTSEGRRQCCSSFLRNLTFSVICDKMLYITHHNKPTSLCCYYSANHHHAVNCENPADLTRCDPHESYQVNCCCTVSHRTACYA